MDDLAGKVVVVTGAASGIGRAMADAFADRLEQSHELLKNGGTLRKTPIEAQSDRVDVAAERRFVGLEAYKQAIDAGATSLMEPDDMFWGDRFSSVQDPFGHSWTIATHIEDVSPEEMQKRSEEWAAQMAGAQA